MRRYKVRFDSGRGLQAIEIIDKKLVCTKFVYKIVLDTFPIWAQKTPTEAGVIHILFW
jgi:hypothetical protein